MAYQVSAGGGVTGTTPILLFADPAGATSVFFMNGGTSGTLYLHVPGLHSDGEWHPVDPIGFMQQKVGTIIFTLPNQGIKKVWGYRSPYSAWTYWGTVEV